MLAEKIRDTRKDQQLTQGSFAEALCAWLPGINLSRQSISNWETGHYQPDYMFLLSVAIAYTDWRHSFAIECLELLRPEVWGEVNLEEIDAAAEVD